jgi:hypothetical protein
MAIAAASAAAQEKGIHIDEGKSVGFSWYVNDGAGFRWDISSNGQVGDGTNDCYDGGVQLRIGGAYFSSSGQGRLSKDGREVEIGPWNQGNLRIWRRVYVDDKIGYCRWIDIFENSAADTQTVNVQYYSNMGGTTAATMTTGGKAELNDKDWGIVTGYDASSGGGRPVVFHVWGNKGSRLLPKFRFTRGNDEFNYDVQLKVPGRKSVAVCLFEAQRSSMADAQKLMQDFNPRKELAKVSPGLRKIIANMGGAMLVLGNLDLPRNEKSDLVVLRNENELLGTILNDKFEVEAFYGKVVLPAAKVVGINVPAPDDPHVQVMLADGQVAAGKLLNAPIKLKLTSGGEMSLPVSQIACATFALSADRPEEVKLGQPVVVLRSGETLSFRKGDLDCTFHTEQGEVKLSPEDLRAIHLDTPEGGLHRATFRNGSVLSGLLTVEKLKLGLDLGPTLEGPRDLVSQFLFPAADGEAAELADVTLRNDDQLFGRIADASLSVATRYGKVAVDPNQLAELGIAEEGTLGQVKLKLHNGTTVTGKLVGDTIQFRIVPGPVVPLYIGHIVQINCPKPPEAAGAKPSTQPAADKAAGDSPTPASDDPSTMDEKDKAARVAELEKRYADLSSQRSALSARGGSSGYTDEMRAEASRLMTEMSKVRMEIRKLKPSWSPTTRPRSSGPTIMPR